MRYLTPFIEELLSSEERMLFIAGPRQVGKTTLARQFLEAIGSQGNYFIWDNDAHRKAILRRPDFFWDADISARAPSGKIRVVLDEIHKYPRWKRFLKGLFDLHKKDLEIIVTGSGRLDIYQRGGDSLFGRYTLLHLHPFSLGEFLRPDRATARSPDAFWATVEDASPQQGADDALNLLERFSGFPEPLFAGSDAKARRWRREHHRLIVREDLRDLTRIREIGLLESMMSLLPERVGSPLSINGLREDLNVAFDTVQGWLSALARLYYLFELRPYAGKLSRALRREGKIYFFDFTEVEDPGPRFENIVAVHLKKLVDVWTDWGDGMFDLHYVRNREKKETDFLITRQGRPYALIEAKLSDRAPDPSLAYFKERLKAPHVLQVVRNADASLCRDPGSGILVASAAHFLSCI